MNPLKIGLFAFAGGFGIWGAILVVNGTQDFSSGADGWLGRLLGGVFLVLVASGCAGLAGRVGD